MRFFWPALLAIAILTGCAPQAPPPPRPPDRLVLKPVRYADMYGWSADSHTEAFAAFLRSCDAFNQQNETDANGQDQLLAPVSVWQAVCRRAMLVRADDEAQTRAFFEINFLPFKAYNNGDSGGLFTGYYEPLLLGSRFRHRPFVYPVYGLPPAGTPSYTRAQIDLGILEGEAPVLAYVDDPVQLFFLQIQGSGRIRLEDESVMHVGYAGNNGYPYTAIGRVLVEKHIMNKDDVNMPSLRQWLYDHPNDMWQVMWQNQSYVFLREMQGPPIGTEQVPLTPGRTLAVDAHYVPLGMPVFIDTMYPATPYSSMTIERRLMIAQDTGGAIKGPVRGDIFFGFGPAAEAQAGQMKSGGEYVLLVPRPLALYLQQPHP